MPDDKTPDSIPEAIVRSLPERPQVPEQDTARIRVAHASMQFSDSPSQMQHDAKVLFDRGYDWITGTEAGPGADPLEDLLRKEAAKKGYRVFVPNAPTDGWIAVSRDFMADPPHYERAYVPVIPGSEALKDQGVGVQTRFGPKGVISVEFTPKNERIAPRIGVATAHYLTRARVPSSALWPWNRRLAKQIGVWADNASRGRALAFYGGDQNMADSRNNQPQGDTFFGEDLTSLADELRRWQNTGHGPIDVIASHDSDTRVTGRRFTALDDSEVFLHTDHFLTEGVFDVVLLPERP